MNVSELSAIITALATVIYTLGTFLLWRATNQSIKLLKSEVKSQLAFNQSSATHASLDAHLELVLEIIRDKVLLETFASELNVTKEQTRKNFLASLFINHAYRLFADHKYRLTEQKQRTGFELNARELFSHSFIKIRWDEVKEFHAPDFREFVEKKILA